MEFRKENRSCQTPRGSRLATVEEATQNLERIKSLFNKWDKVRLLDGWLSVGADGEIRGPEVGFRHGLGYMLIIITRPALEISADGSAPGAEGYGEVVMNEEGKQSALLLCAEDLNYELVDWLLNFAWPNVNKEDANTQAERDEKEIVRIREFSEAVSRFVREFPNGNARASKTEQGERNLHQSALEMMHNVHNHCAEYLTSEWLGWLSSVDDGDNGANPLDSDGDGKTILHYAVDGIGDVEEFNNVVRLLIERDLGITKVVDKNGRTILHAAALLGKAELCEKLSGVLGMCKDRDGETPMHYAVKQNNKAVVEVLLEYSEEIEIHKVDLRDLSGVTPLHIAAAQGNLTLVKILLSHLPQKFARIGDFLGETALHKAARIGHIEIIKKLLESGSQPLQERDCDGKTALHYAVQVKKRDDAVAIAKLLVEKCKSDEEQFLLLWASAAGIGTAEESLRSQAFDNDPVKAFFDQHQKKMSETQCNLVRAAAKLGYIDMTQEFLTRGGDIADLLNSDWQSSLSKKEKDNVDRVVKQIKNRIEQASEQPTLSDDLGRKDYAMGLAAFFLSPYVKSPITVGISGEWGMGKSSLMFQTEIILLKTAAQLAFPNLLEVHENFPGAKNLNLTKEGQKRCHDIRRSLEVLLAIDQESKANLIGLVFAKIRRWTRHLFGTEQKTEVKIKPRLFYFLENYEPKYHAVYKSLALVGGCSNMIERNGEKSDSNNESIVEAVVPAILTVRYNAWEYRNESEGWAGLAVEITKEMEETMTLAQWLSTCWRTHKRSIWVAVILPCLLAAIVASCITWLAWLLLERSKQKGLEELKYGSLAATVLVIVWTAVKSIMAVLKPISAQIAGYISLPDHTEKLGYHQQVIEDINFLKVEIGKQPYWLCTIIAFLWCLIRLDWSPNYVRDTSFPKMRPQFNGNLRIIVLVDDLDRCQESVILQVLTAINLVLAVCKIDVILGMEKKMIDRAIIKKYGDKSSNKSKKSNEELANKFFQKIIQLPLDLPDPSDVESKRFLEGQLGSLVGDFKTELDGDFETEHKSESLSRSPSIDNGGKTSTFDQGESGGQGVKEREPSSAPGSEETLTINEAKNEALGGQGMKEREPSSAPAISEETLTINVSENEVESEALGERKLNLEMSREIFLPKYSYGERNAFSYLQTMATGSRRLPREWKRMLNYHRLAWNIFSKSKEAKSLVGWQVQLIAWIFVCWEWKDRLDTIIQTWHKLDVICNWKYFAKDWHQFKKGPSLREIVDYSMEEQRAGKVKSNKGDTILKKVRGKEEEEEMIEEKDMKVIEGGSRKYEEVKIKVLSKQKEGMSKGCEKCKRKISKLAHEEELEDWEKLSKTLRRYNVSMEGMQVFQRFRFYCNYGYLPWPTPNMEITYEWEYFRGERPRRIV
eukprot:Gb_08864 [translate_table: standard]